MELLPALLTMGVCEFQHNFARCWRELSSGAVIHIVHKRNGLHRAWLVPPPLEPGFEAVPIGCNELRAHLGQVFDFVRDGTVFQVCDMQGAPQSGVFKTTVRGYLQLTPPEGLARLDTALHFTVRSFGRTRLRDIRPTETKARL